jgi:hypothetical protein
MIQMSEYPSGMGVEPLLVLSEKSSFSAVPKHDVKSFSLSPSARPTELYCLDRRYHLRI